MSHLLTVSPSQRYTDPTMQSAHFAVSAELSFSGDLLFRDSNSNLSAREHLDFLNSRNPHSAKGLDNVSYTTFYI